MTISADLYRISKLVKEQEEELSSWNGAHARTIDRVKRIEECLKWIEERFMYPEKGDEVLDGLKEAQYLVQEILYS